MTTTRPLIEIENLHHTYEERVHESIAALRGIDLTIDSGEFVAIVGPNGSGKTTLARHLNALLLPTEGMVRVAGMDTREQTLWSDVRSTVSMVFQHPEDQIVATTVEDDVAFGPENVGVPPEDIDRRVREALERVDMWRHRARAPHLLSAGQQQRVAIAGALAMEPECLVLDEATAMLDPRGRQELLNILRTLHSEGITLLFITHHMTEASLADRVVVLNEGRIAFDGSPERLFSTLDLISSLGLDVPPLIALSARLRRHWDDLPKAPMSPEGLADALVDRFENLSSVPGTHSRMPSGERLVSVEDVRHIYLDGTPLSTLSLDGVSFAVQEGESIALLGATGAGKSTLLEHVAGIIPPQEGEVVLDGRSIRAWRKSPKELRERVGLVFQRPEEQLFETYVGDDVAFGPRQLELDRDAVRERVRWAMDVVGLPFQTYKDRFTQQLSGGERRKAALAGVLALRPRLLLLDEPTAGLDPQARRDLLSLLRRLRREEGLTLVIATHNMEDVTALCDRAVVMDEGRVVLTGTIQDVFAQADRLRALGLDVPPIVALAHALRDRGLSIPEDVLTVDDAERVLLAGEGVPS